MSRLFIYLVCQILLGTVSVSAQSFEEYKRQQQAKFNSYAQKKADEFRAYRDRVNAEYADFMRKAWTREEPQPAEPLPKRPEPPKPVVRENLDIPQFDAIPVGDVIKPEVPDFKKAKPIIPLDELEQLVMTAPKEPAKDEKPQEEVKPKEDVKPVIKPQEEVKPEGFAFNWCGQTWSVPLDNQHRFRLKSVNEAAVADAWEALSETRYACVVAASLKIKNAYQLPDWGYLFFLKAMTNAFLPGMTNEARLLQMFILSQSGYQVRIARSNNQLYLLVPSSGNIYEYTYLTMGGQKYYVVDKTSGRGSFAVFERDFPNAQPFNWQMDKLPNLLAEGSVRTLHAKKHPGTPVAVNVNKGLVALLNEYPRCNDMDGYAYASLSKQVKESMYPALRQLIKGKSKMEATGLLLDFVQTAFEYKTDEEQFGKERPLFGDETLFYPFCDCEDRSILFSILVRELLGLDVVLLHYPGHLATAVCFDEDVKGDYMTLNGRRYVVCDPTYIGAPVGEAMPNCKNQRATIVKL